MGENLNISNVEKKELVNLDNNIPNQNNNNNENVEFQKNEIINNQNNNINIQNNNINNQNKNNLNNVIINQNININNLNNNINNQIYKNNNYNNNPILNKISQNKEEEKIFTNRGSDIDKINQNNIDNKNFINNQGDDDKILNDMIINNNDNKKDEGYLFNCTNSIYLSVYIYQGTDVAEFEIYLKNNGAKIWAENSKLIIDKSSDCHSDEIILAQQKPNEERSYKIIVKDLSNYPVGEYKAVFSFWSGGKIYGEKITAIVKIIEKKKKKSEIDEYMDKIQEFRDTFNLSEDEYANEKILDILKENDFNFENAFSSLFN